MATNPTPVTTTNGIPLTSVLPAGQSTTVAWKGANTYTDPNTGTQSASGLVTLSDPTGTIYALVDAQQNLYTRPNSFVTPKKTQAAVSAASTGSVASLPATFGSPNVVGNTIIVVAAVGNSSAPTIADTNTNTYTEVNLGANSTTFGVSIWYAPVTTGGANTVTVTNGGSAASMAITIYEVSGLVSPVVADQASTGNNTGTSATTSAITPGAPNGFAVAGVAVGTAAQTITPAAGWTNDSGQQNTTTPAGLYSFVAMSWVLPTLATVTPKATFTSEPWAMAAVIFRPAVAAIAGVTVTGGQMSTGGYQFTYISTNTTTQCKIGPGLLHVVSVNTLVASATIELDDALSHTTPKIGIITCPSTITSAIPFTVEYDLPFVNGLSVTTSGATDITVVWK